MGHNPEDLICFPFLFSPEQIIILFPTDSKPKQTRKIQQLDHPQIQPHRMAESLQPVKFNFKGVEVVTHVEEEEANTNPSSAKKLRGMPVKQPKVIAINTITKYFVNLSVGMKTVSTLIAVFEFSFLLSSFFFFLKYFVDVWQDN